MKGIILIVDDEAATRRTLSLQLSDEGFEVHTASNGFEAIEILEREPIDVVVTDLRMPSMNGRELQRIAHERWPDVAIVFTTAFGTIASAVEAMREGAADYLPKPIDTDELVIRVQRLVERRRDIIEIRHLRADAGKRLVADQIVFRSTSMQAAVERALSVAEADVTVLVEGETGSGKGVLARAVHDHSPRSSAPFVAVNCAELNPNLVESELFGHEAGAFTGAVRRRVGRFETASGGTLLIDDIDDLPREIQVRLLRFLQDRVFERVGSSTTIRGNVRVLCATKRSLADLVRDGLFREDLFYRINAIKVVVPPLRERRDDIPVLAEHFLRSFAAAQGPGAPPELLPETMHVLMGHDWPGNVRELKHAIEHAVTFCHGQAIDPRHLPEHLRPAAQIPPVSLHLDGLDTVSFHDVVTTCERGLVDWALARTGGNQVRAAEMLQMSRTTLRKRIGADPAEAPDREPDAEPA